MNPQVASTAPQPVFLKPIWTELIGPPWLVSLVVLLVLAGVRFFAFLSPYGFQELYFLQTVGMWTVPFALLTPHGRRQIGFTGRGITLTSMLLSAFAGIACGLILWSLGMAIFGNSPNNWCLSIRNYLHFDEMRGLLSPLGIFAVYALPAVFLNPVGEEIFFRGFLQESFALRFNRPFATVVNSVLFGFVYLSLHGIFQDASGYHIRLASAALAVFLLACIGVVFNLCRNLFGSIWPSMAAHAAFNLTILAAAIHRFAH